MILVFFLVLVSHYHSILRVYVLTYVLNGNTNMNYN